MADLNLTIVTVYNFYCLEAVYTSLVSTYDTILADLSLTFVTGYDFYRYDEVYTSLVLTF